MQMREAGLHALNGHGRRHNVGELIDAGPPKDTDAEQMVLRHLVTDGKVIDAASDLTAEHFADERHRVIFAAVATLREDKRPIDIPHLCDVLDECGQLDEIGGKSYLTDLLDNIR